MKKVLDNQFWKSILAIGGILLISVLFRLIENQTIKTLIGLSGFLLIVISHRKIKSQQNENLK